MGIPLSSVAEPISTSSSAAALTAKPAVAAFLSHGNTAGNRATLMALLRDGAAISDRIGDEKLDMVRLAFRRFADERIMPTPTDGMSHLSSMSAFALPHARAAP